MASCRVHGSHFGHRNGDGRETDPSTNIDIYQTRSTAVQETEGAYTVCRASDWHAAICYPRCPLAHPNCISQVLMRMRANPKMGKKLKLRWSLICQCGHTLFKMSLTRKVCCFPIRSMSNASLSDPCFSADRARSSNSISLCGTDLSILSVFLLWTFVCPRKRGTPGKDEDNSSRASRNTKQDL